MNDIISIIIPVYNTSSYLSRCLDSVINQSYTNLEIILIDDGSTDSSSEICKKYQKNDKRIKYVRKSNEGAASARNLGIDMASGSYIGFVDSDDVIHPDMYLTLYNNLIKNNAEVSICDVVRFNNEPEFSNTNNIILYDKVTALKILLEDNKICSYSVNKLCKAEIIKNIKYPEKKLQEDVGTVYKFIMGASKIVYSDSKLYGYFKRDESITNTISHRFIYDYFEMIERRRNDLKDYDICKYLDLNETNVILGCFIDLSNNKELLKDKKFKKFMLEKRKNLRKFSNVKKLNTKKHNVLISILLVNAKLFLMIMHFYIKMKMVLS